MKHVRRTHLATGALGVLTAGVLAATGAPIAQADTMYAWSGGGAYTCAVTGGGHEPSTENWSFSFIIDDNAVTWKVGQPIPAQQISVNYFSAAGFTHAPGVTSFHGHLALHYSLGEVPITADFAVPTSKVPSSWDTSAYADGVGQSFVPTHAGDYRGKLGVVTGDIMTNTGDTRHLTCTLKPSEDPRTGYLTVVDPNATPTTSPSTPTTAPSSSPVTAPTSKPGRPTNPAQHPGAIKPSKAPNTSATSHAAATHAATPHGPSVQTDHVAASTSPSPLAAGIAVGTLAAGAAGLTLVRRRRSN